MPTSDAMTEHDPKLQREGFDARISGIAALGEPVRRALYRYVAEQPSPVNRDQAAEGVGVARHVAKFHLDKLVDDGLLEVEFRRPPGRSGPGAGRPAKLYRRSSRELEVSLPDRRYDLAGRLMARAITDAGRDRAPVSDALSRVARQAGSALGQEARRRVGRRPSRTALTAATCEVLAELGYEPRTVAGEISLSNCPFHSLAADHAELVCAMNLDLLTGILDGLGDEKLRACLEPSPGMCCVRLRKDRPPPARGDREEPG